MNYGEEIACWYLRLNGFFLISNFVIHRTEGIQYSADADVLAVRPPHVFEPVGGQDDDWDPQLAQLLGFHRTVGLICEVKTGAFKANKLFRPAYVKSCVGRLGLVTKGQIETVATSLEEESVVETGCGSAVAKLLITDTRHDSEPYITFSFSQVEKFLEERIEKYPQDKFRDRMFFPSGLFQHMIHRADRQTERQA